MCSQIYLACSTMTDHCLLALGKPEASVGHFLLGGQELVQTLLCLTDFLPLYLPLPVIHTEKQNWEDRT